MGFSLSHTSKMNMLDLIGGHFSDRLVEEVRCGKKIQGTGDNWDMKIHAHDMLSTNQNTDLHYFASNLIVERVRSENLSNVSPQLKISSLHNTAFLLDSNEANKLRDDISVSWKSSVAENTALVVFETCHSQSYRTSVQDRNVQKNQSLFLYQ
jgi:hypothetical protein